MSSTGKINHDQSTLHISGIWIGFYLVVGLLSVCIIGSMIYYRGVVSKELDKKEKTDITLERRQLEIYEDEKLNDYKWINKTKGIVQIPIKEAMKKVVKKYGN